jgi:ERCC4-type nuclease
MTEPTQQEDKDFKFDQRQVKIVDTREPETIKYKLLEIGWQTRKLYSGDYSFFTHDYVKVGITRKSMDDFLNSIGELFSKQLEEMLDFYEIRILIIEGSWKSVSPTQNMISGRGIEYTTWQMVWNYLRRFQDKGITLELTTSEGHTVKRLGELYALYQKPYSLVANSRKFSDERILAFPSGCRGETAQNCLLTFGSLNNVANATLEQLMAVPKIGNKKARSIHEHFNKNGDKNIFNIEIIEDVMGHGGMSTSGIGDPNSEQGQLL